MISAHATPARTLRYPLYAWLLAGLLLFFGIALVVNLLQNMPEAQQNNEHAERIERIQKEQQCNVNEVVVVVGFAPHVYKAYCVAKG